MTDRELLEKAAKAAGVPHKWNQFWRGLFIPREDGSWEAAEWNPLKDDGDALRLAVKLNICVLQDDAAAVSAGWARNQHVPFTSDGSGPWYWKEWLLRESAGDAYACTRRAIVRAAASLAGD